MDANWKFTELLDQNIALSGNASSFFDGDGDLAYEPDAISTLVGTFPQPIIDYQWLEFVVQTNNPNFGSIVTIGVNTDSSDPTLGPKGGQSYLLTPQTLEVIKVPYLGELESFSFVCSTSVKIKSIRAVRRPTNLVLDDTANITASFPGGGWSTSETGVYQKTLALGEVAGFALSFVLGVNEYAYVRVESDRGYASCVSNINPTNSFSANQLVQEYIFDRTASSPKSFTLTASALAQPKFTITVKRATIQNNVSAFGQTTDNPILGFAAGAAAPILTQAVLLSILGGVPWLTTNLTPTNLVNVSQLSNDAGYLTGAALLPYAPLVNPSFTGPVTVTAAANLGGIFITGAQNNLGITLTNTQAGNGGVWQIMSTATGSGYVSGALVIAKNGTGSFVAIDTNGSVGIGTQLTPLYHVHIRTRPGIGAVKDPQILIDGDQNKERLSIRSAVAGGAVVGVFSSNGTIDAPTATQAGDILGYYLFGGYESVTPQWIRSAWVQSVAGENWTAAARGSYISCSTTPNGSTVIAEALRISNNAVAINNSTPNTWAGAAGDGVLQIGAQASLAALTGGISASLINNASYGGTWTYQQNAAASMLALQGGSLTLYGAPVGAAGAGVGWLQLALFSTTLLTVSTPYSFGGAPEYAETTGVISNTAVGMALKQGTVAAPKTNTTLNTPVLYIERYTNNADDTTVWSGWSNVRMIPAILVESISNSADRGNPVGIAARSSSSFGAPTTNTTGPLVGGVFMGYSSAGSGQHREIFGANIIANFSNNGATKPKNCVGIEVDVIPGVDSGTGAPGNTDNFTGVWVQAAGYNGATNTNAVCTAAIYVSDANLSGGVRGGWQWGLYLKSNFRQNAVYIANDYATGNGLAVIVQPITSANIIINLFSNNGGTENFRVDCDPANSVWARVNSTLKQLVVGAADSGGVGFRMVRVTN